jgi:ABC-type amino acid transport system permease subunit
VPVASRKDVVGAAALGVSLAGALVAAILAIHVAFVAFEANADNGVVSFIRALAHFFVGAFRDLFLPDGVKKQVVVDYGLAALVYLALALLLARAIRRLGGS